MKRISGGQLSLGVNATLLLSHAGGPRAAAGDTSFAGQAKQSTQASRVSPPPAREPTGQAGRHRPSSQDDDSDRRLARPSTDKCSSSQARAWRVGRSRPRSAVNSLGSRRGDGVGSLKSCKDEEGGLRRETYRTAVGGDRGPD